MDIEKILFEELNNWVYNDQNQAGDNLQIIDASDFQKIIRSVSKKCNEIHNVSDLLNSLGSGENEYKLEFDKIDGSWWIIHTGVGSGEPLEQWLTNRGIAKT